MEFFARRIGDPPRGSSSSRSPGWSRARGGQPRFHCDPDRAPAPEKRSFGRRLGAWLALITRLILCRHRVDRFPHDALPAHWLQPFVARHHPACGRLFLIYKATRGDPRRDRREEDETAAKSAATGHGGRDRHQIAFIDIIFSLDSVITAVGMADHLWVMVTAVMIAMALMITAANPLSEFVSRHPTVKMLAPRSCCSSAPCSSPTPALPHPQGLRVQRPSPSR